MAFLLFFYYLDGAQHEVMVSEAALDSFGNVVHVHTTTLQPLQTLQSFTYHPASVGRSSHSSSAAATTAAAYRTDGYHGGGYRDGEQQHYNSGSGNASGSGRMNDPNMYSKIELISYKPALHGATSQVYGAMSPPQSSYDHTVTIHSAATQQATTYNLGEGGGSQ